MRDLDLDLAEAGPLTEPAATKTAVAFISDTAGTCFFYCNDSAEMPPLGQHTSHFMYRMHVLMTAPSLCQRWCLYWSGLSASRIMRLSARDEQSDWRRRGQGPQHATCHGAYVTPSWGDERTKP